MKNIFLVCLLLPLVTTAQVLDDFSDGNFTSNTVWTGDTSQFEVNAALQLHLKSTGSDTSVLFTECEEYHNYEWNFWMKLSFNTSSGNYARVYLTADRISVVSEMNGFFLQAGGGADSIYIVRQTGKLQEKVYRFSSCTTNHSTNILRFKITCDDAGRWEAFVDTTGGLNYTRDGGFYDITSFPVRWFGVYCRYTASNAAKFWFDDFYAGPVVIDSIPPVVTAQEVVSDREITLGFSEHMEGKSIGTVANYHLSPGGQTPDSAVMNLLKPAVSLYFHEPMTDGATNSLTVTGLKDLAGNKMADTLIPVSYYRPKAFDVVINEIMADPDPPVGLPDEEYVELYNRTAFAINLRNWTFIIGGNAKVFPAVVIPAKGFLLITRDSLLSAFGECAVILTSSTSLSNEGTTLALKDRWNRVIHAVSYTPAWFRGSFKGEGGWSLEMEDPANPCGCSENWRASEDAAGGTPGKVNSVYRSDPDVDAPCLRRAVVTGPSAVEAFFSEAMDSTSLLAPSGWEAVYPDGVLHPTGVEPVAPLYSAAGLVFDRPFEPGITYILRVSGTLTDCAGNPADTNRSARFAIPDTVARNDIVINEILSNPAAGGARFAELFNRSEKVIDLQSVAISGKDTAGGTLPGAEPLFSSGYILFPGEYIALTADPADILARYHTPAPEAVVLMPGFPVLGDEKGTVILARRDNNLVIDKENYDAGMHYPLLITTSGVSLERSCPDIPSGQRDNWHSAAETAGFATPGYLNSHVAGPGDSGQELIAEPVIFSPDNDGHDDLLTITIREKEPDNTAGIEIYDAQGRLVVQLANHVLLGAESVFIWDGMTAGKTRAPMGFYIILAEIVSPDGTVKRLKRTTILGGKL
ncbi:MAG: lamin tail domain-containing protein [Bacteroidota bacterium]